MALPCSANLLRRALAANPASDRDLNARLTGGEASRQPDEIVRRDVSYRCGEKSAAGRELRLRVSWVDQGHRDIKRTTG